MVDVKKVIAVVLLAAAIGFGTIPAAADSYISYSYDAYGDDLPAPSAYAVKDYMINVAYNGMPLNQPEDLFVAPDGMIYICDTGNNRIVVLNSDYSLVRTINAVTVGGKTQGFNAPQGIFVTKDGKIYICDSGNARILITNRNFVENSPPLTKPNSNLISASTAFNPLKVAVDSAGNVYVVAYGMYEGLITYDSSGNFTGFFGSNRVQLNISDELLLFWKNLFSQQQQNSTVQFVPVEYSNLYIDDEDSVYTTTSKTTDSLDEIKKLNALGDNVLRYEKQGTLYSANNFGDLHTSIENNQLIDSRFEDIQVDKDGVISAVDAQRCRIFQYDQDCNLMFIFGGKGQQKGLFEEPVAVDKEGEDYIVLDKAFGSITVFQPTDYAKEVRKATLLYNDGLYVQSKKLWENVLQHNGYYSLAYKGIGKALLQQGDYTGAMQYLKKGGDREMYSQAFSQWRKLEIRKNLGYYIIGLVVGIAGLAKLLAYILRRLGIIQPKQKKRQVES